MKTQILIIGAGGIGSLLVDHVSRAFAFSDLSESVGELEMTLMDGDTVESRNLPHQQFGHSDQSMHKISAIQQRIEAAGMLIGNRFELAGIVENFSAETNLSKYDLVVVAVDREEPRELVHSTATNWLDLRARGDGFVMWSHQDNYYTLDNLPKLPEGTSTSCQLDEAVESGNIQFGFALAAAHGAQWIIQWLRGASTPSAKMYSIHMGEFPLPQMTQELVE